MHILGIVLIFVGGLALVAAVVAATVKLRENRRLDEVVAELGLDGRSRSDAVLTTSRWVYRNQGFAKNHGAFVISRLGPTATQVLDRGGDCADKSRLVMALLDRAGIPSTLAMLYGTADGPPTHVVVEAEYEHGRMVVDPVFDLDFPGDSEGNRYFGLRELRADPNILERRVAELTRLRGASDDKVSFYKLRTEHYSYARTMNLEKNAVTRAVAALLVRTGLDPTLVPRPVLFEDPIRLIATAAGIAGLMLVAVGWWLV